MNISENFDRFAGTARKLSEINPFKLRIGTDDLSVNSSGQLARTSGSSSLVFYGTGNPTSAGTQMVKADLKATINYRITLRASVSGAALNGYTLHAQTGMGAVRLSRLKDGSATALLTVNTVGGNADAVELRSTINADGSNTLTIWQNDAQLAGGSFTDSVANTIFTGERGLAVTTTGSATAAFDRYVDNSGVVPFVLTSPTNGEVFEGVRLVSRIAIPVTWPGAPAAIEARLVGADDKPLPGFDWTVKIASPSAGGSGTLVFDGVPVGLDYREEVRDAAKPVETFVGLNRFGVGAVYVLAGRSQASRTRVQSGDNTLAPVAGNRVSVQYLNSSGSTGLPVVATLTGGQGTLSSGIVAAANRWMQVNPSIPLKIVDASMSSMALTDFLNDTSVGVPAWGLWEGYVKTTLAATHNRVTGVVMLMADPAGSGAQTVGYQANMEACAAKFDAILGTPRYGVMPHLRASNGPFVDSLRQQMFDFARADPARRVVAGWALDHALVGGGDPHQANGPTGNQRLGTRLGQAFCKLYDPAIDVAGPRVVGYPVWVDPATPTQFDVDWDRDIEMPAGATTGFKGPVVAIDTGAFGNGQTLSAERIGPRRLRVTSDVALPLLDTRFDIMRGTPFEDDSTQPAYVGPAADMEANFLSRVITDTSGFDGGRGMPAAPIMGRGLPVASPVTLTFAGNASVIKGLVRRAQ